MKKAEDLKLVFFGQTTGDLAIEALHAEFIMDIYNEGFAWPGLVAMSWDSPMLVMYDMTLPTPAPVGFIALSSSKWIKEVGIQGFYIKPAYRGLNFIKLLTGIKKHILKEYPSIRYITWSTHWTNDRIRGICRRLGMEPRSVSYQMDLSTGSPEDPRVTTRGESITT